MIEQIVSGLGKLSVGEGVLSEGKRLLAKARDLAAPGVLSYGMIVARKLP